MIDLSIIIVSWNVRAFLEQCLVSIERTCGNIALEVFVVDNASTDGTIAWLLNYESGMRNQASHPLHDSVFIIPNSANKGFAAANNQGIARAKGRYILLLNPDTELYEASLQRMISFMDAHPRCGVLGPRLLNADGSHQPSVRRLPDAWSPTLLSLGMTRGPARRYLALDMDYTRAQQVEQVMGACLLTRRATIDKIGTLDERFFIWFEEVDFCCRARENGWEVWYTPDATVAHHGGQSFAQVFTPRKQWWFSRSLLHYFWKHGQWGAWLVNVALVTPRLIASSLSFFMKH